MKVLNYFDGFDHKNHPIKNRHNTGASMCRTGMALSVKQLYERVMLGQGHTGIVDQPGNYDKYDDDNNFPPDERELAAVHEYVNSQQAKASEAAKELAGVVVNKERDKAADMDYKD